ncbi:MAG: alkaline phosphatase family protein [Acidobacteriota bacterium]
MVEHDLASVRAELQRRGYLTHGLERMLLQDALRSRTGVRALLRLALRTAVLGGGLLALPVALGLALANGNLDRSPFDLAPLVLHLVPPLAVVAGALFLALAGAALLLARLRPGRGAGAEGAGDWLALAGVAALFASLAWQGRGLLIEAPVARLLLLAAAATIAGAALWRLWRSGLFALTVRWVETPLRQTFAPRVWLALLVAGAALFVAVPILVLLRPGTTHEAPSNLPSAPGERVLLLGVDGVLPEELEYLLQHGDLPALARLRDEGVFASYQREDEPLAAFWTTVATGLPSSAHGVAALDSFRPRGVRTPLANSGLLRWYWLHVAVPMRIAEYRPVLSNRRTAFTVWEMAARGGAPVLAIDWWGTYPAEVLPGLVVAHGGYQLLADSAAGAVAPESEREGLEALRRQVDPVAAAKALAAALPADQARALLAKAFLGDQFYLDVFAARVAAEPRATALYLPGLDIAADGWKAGAVPFADVVRAQLAALDREVAKALAGVGTLAVVVDPGRRGGLGGRVLLWRVSGCKETKPAEIQVSTIAAALLRALGLPQSAELAQPPAGCAWPAAPAQVPSYGRRAAGADSSARSDEYLKNLKSLGYL